MKASAALWVTLAWLSLGMIGFGANNALYQNDVHSNYDRGGCWVKEHEWRHTRHELGDLIFAAFGPVYFVVAFVNTGGFSQGLSFHIGVPKRCQPKVFTEEELKLWNQRPAQPMTSFNTYDFPRVPK